jgi:hypothetical protein
LPGMARWCLVRTKIARAANPHCNAKPARPGAGRTLAGNPNAYVQMKAGHSHAAITERYIHAAQVMFPGAADKTEQRLFRNVEDAPV